MASLSAQNPGIPSRADSAKNARIKWVNGPKPGTLPEGVTHRTFRSAALGRDVGYCLYLPPDYATDIARRYPVIYNLHAALLAAGVDHTDLEVEGLAHEHDQLVTMYRTSWYDYHAESFRRAAGR